MNIIKIQSIIICFLLFFCAIESNAQDKQKRGNAFILYLNAPSATKISTEISDNYEIGKTSWMADFGLEMKIREMFTISGGMGIGDIKDYNSFSQNTTLGEMESTFTTLSYDIKGGVWIPEFPLIKKRDLEVAIGSSVGIEGFKGIREIDNCSNCNRESFNFNGGLFVEPELNLFFFQDILGIGTSYRYYFSSGDLESKIILIKLMLRMNVKK